MAAIGTHGRQCSHVTSYAATTASIDTPNSTGQRCAKRAPATNDGAHSENLLARVFCLER